ncbi:glutamate receptor ionotropic, kainate 4 [Dermacentor silvarum]|uniref:glutamate receptor ionotropic, kainate 4 n=1 Tax=Dermacentor silvarum TaxID=543639 RepID=UPI001898D5D6|nr:glutamate receptor ionotropic, kainate 4 [Dermacentor silvarum]
MKPMLEVSVVDGEVIFGGLGWYLIQSLQKALRFNVQLQTTDEQIWSSRRPTGEWGGPLGMLERNESDISAHPVIPTADRITVGTPLPAYVYANPRYYAGTPNEYLTSVFGYLMSFDLEVWLGLLLCWPLVSALISFIEAVRSPVRFKDTITDNLFDILGVMMFEGSIRPVRDVIGRVVFAVWWLAVLVLMNSFQGTMKASMSVKTPTERLETFRDLAERPHLRPIIIRGTTFVHQFQVSPEWELQTILAMARRHRSILPAPVVFTRETFDEMIAKHAIIFMEDNVMQSYIGALYPEKPGLGTIYPSKQHTISAQFCMFMRKSLEPRIMKLLHTRCRWMHESGLTERKRLQLQPRSWYPSRPDSSQVHSLSAEDTAALFYMVLLGQVIALTVFLGELVAHRFTSRNSSI